MRPDAILFKGEYIATQLTEHEKDIWELGQIAGIAAAFNALRARVAGMQHPDEGCGLTWRSPRHAVECDCLISEVLALIDGGSE